MLVTVVMVLTGFILALIGYRMVVAVTTASIKDQVKYTTALVRNEVVQVMHQPIQAMLDPLSQGPLPTFDSKEKRLQFLPVLKSLLNNTPVLSSLYVGHADGSFFLAHKLGTETERQAHNVPPEAAFLVVHASSSTPGGEADELFYDTKLHILARRPAGSASSFDPRVQEWYRQAMSHEGQTQTTPRLLWGTREPAMAFSRKSSDGKAVVGADILLAALSDFLVQELPTPNARLALIQSDGTLVAAASGIIEQDAGETRLRTVDDLKPVMRKVANEYLRNKQSLSDSMRVDGKEWEVVLEAFEAHGVNTAVLLAIPWEDLHADGMTFLFYSLLGMGGVLLFSVPLVWFAARRMFRPFHSLAEQAGDLPGFMRNGECDVSQELPELQALAGSMNRLQGTIRQILTITQTLSSERNFDALLQRLLVEILPLVKADGGLVALLDEEKKIVPDEGSVCWVFKGKKRVCSFMRGQNLSMALPVYQALTQDMVMQTSISREDPRSCLEQLAPGFEDPAVYRVDVVCLPLHDRMGEHIGSLALFKRVRAEANGFKHEEVRFMEAFAALAAIALENQRLIKGQNNLRDALIHILAGAIDAKSPYTGGHCQRVPVIFQMLLEAACEAKEGPLASFVLDEDGWEEAKLAAWLHDCGKVTTPEHVVDKATKLETIYDRIHEIRTRFEVLKRDAEIISLHSVLDGADPALARRALEMVLRSLDEDFAFVASCNLGSEYLSDEARERLAVIGKRTWVRTLDKRLGVSRNERERMECANTPSPPVRETLLMDNPEHIIERGEQDMLDVHNTWGFRLTAPRYLYNRGECYNLDIRRGTLTEEERYKINDHITRTIMMLEAMPLPRHLRNVPEIAGGHHETMDGQGYPRRLMREHMSWSARMMAVADIFEALTASDRPYKTSKTLQETLEIMEGFRERNHIDPDVYELFLASDIPRRYAEQYLKPEQNNLAD